MENRSLRIAAWVGVLVLPVYLVYTAATFDVAAFIKTLFLEDRQVTQGQVIDHHGFQGKVPSTRTRTGRSTEWVSAWLYSPVVRFTLPGGKEIEFTDSRSGTARIYQRGQSVPVVYSSRFPGAAVIYHPPSLPGGLSVLAGVVLLFAFSAGLLARHRGKDQPGKPAKIHLPGEPQHREFKSALLLVFFLLVAGFFWKFATVLLEPFITEGYAKGTVLAHLDPADGQDARGRDVEAVEQVVKFIAPDGTEIRFRTPVTPMAGTMPVGGKVGIVYEVDNPWKARIGEWSLFGFGRLEIAGILGIAVFLIGAYAVRRSRRRVSAGLEAA